VTRPIQPHNHPFPFLLYLEWALLAIAIWTELLPNPSLRFPRFPLLTLLSITGFGLMGLRLPTGKLIYKVIYTAFEIVLILFTSLTGSRAIRLFPFLYLLLVTRSCLIFNLPGRLLITGLSFTFFLLTLQRRFHRIPAPPMAQERLRFFPLLLALLMNAVLAERQSREKLAIANEQLRKYALRIEDQATLQERSRIAREIHDSLGHSLTALNLQIETALKLWLSDSTRAYTFLKQAKKLGSQALQDVRQSVSALRDPLLGRSLEQAIASLAEDFGRSTGVVPSCQIQLANSITTEVSTAIYRIAQEALTNISRHASATEVKIQLQVTKNHLKFTIADNGKGFQLSQNTTGFGLQSMRDRAQVLGGELNINTAPNSGCTIVAEIPLHT
jgi:signal transduction histidine kinase